MADTPRTILVPLDAPAATQTYQLAPGVAQYVEAVYVEVDTSGAGDTTASIAIAEDSGVVFARKAQSQVIDGGGSGSATFALRLGGDGDGSGGGAFATYNSGANPVVIPPDTAVPFPMETWSGGDLLDLTDPEAPTFTRSGFYVAEFMAILGGAPTFLGAVGQVRVYVRGDISFGSEYNVCNVPLNGIGGGWQNSAVLPLRAAVGDPIVCDVSHNYTGNLNFGGWLNLLKVG